MSKKFRAPLLLLTFILLVGIAGVAYFGNMLFTPAGQLTAEPLEFSIGKGETLENISGHLYEAGLIKNRVALKLAAFVYGGGEKIKAGIHLLSYGQNAAQLLESLQLSPKKAHLVLTIPEGKDIYEIAVIIEETGYWQQQEFIDLAFDTPRFSDLISGIETLEGYLFPDTYHIPVDASLEEVIRILLKKNIDVLDQQLIADFQAVGLSIVEGVTMASLIAKEAGNIEEMPTISSVFHNRIAAGMRLDCDPTFIYAAKLAGVWDGINHRSDIDRQSPYNTYLVQGLPPSPIGNPGRAALQAAAHPAATDFLFFVAKSANQKDGHYFNRSYREHQKDAQNYRKAKKAAEDEN